MPEMNECICQNPEAWGYTCPVHRVKSRAVANIETTHGPMTRLEIVGDPYSFYAYNRTVSPDITPEQWERVFGSDTMAMEARYQKERQSKAEKRA